MEILTGILLGLSTLLFVGPVFFYLIQATLQKGTYAGITAALGIILGDILYVYFCLNGLENYLNKPGHIKAIAVTGGLLLLLLGLENFFRKPKANSNLTKSLNKSLVAIFFRAFVLNFVNPFVFVVWVGFLTYSETKFSTQATPLILVFTLAVIFITDIIKVFLAKKLSCFFNTERLLLFRKFTGILMIIFAVKLFWTAI